jgi:hypothetical protein
MFGGFMRASRNIKDNEQGNIVPTNEPPTNLDNRVLARANVLSGLMYDRR